MLLNNSLVAALGLKEEKIEDGISETRRVIEKRMAKFRGRIALPILQDVSVILVDGGLASGFTMLTAVKSVRNHNPKQIVVAVPTASEDTINLIATNIDQLICLNIRREPIFAVANAYKRWHDLSDSEVLSYVKSCKN